MVNFSLEGKVALVTGASYGIGFALATAFARQGAKIVFNDIKQELVDKGLAAYKAEGIDAKGYVCDVTSEAQVNELVAKIEKEVGVIDILVNNAGIIKRIPMTEMTAEQFRQVVDVDLNAPFIVAKAVIPSMIRKGHGKIINICSMMSELGRETVSAYAAAKGGLKMLTRNIASEYGEYNIQCNGIGPGYIATPQTAPLREKQPDGSRHPFDAFIVAKTPVTTTPKCNCNDVVNNTGEDSHCTAEEAKECCAGVGGVWDGSDCCKDCSPTTTPVTTTPVTTTPVTTTPLETCCVEKI